MKKYIYMSMLASLTVLAGCDYNEKYFEGLQEGAVPTDVKSLDYTLTDADYKTIATNSTNKALAAVLDAESGNPDAKTYANALAALTSNKYFTAEAPASMYVPAFLASAYPTADDKSAIKITYNNYVAEPAYLAELTGGSTYKLTDDDYTSVWESKGVEASFLTPKTLSKIPSILKNAKPDAVKGDVLLINYSYSQTEPSITADASEVEVAGEWQEVAIPNMATGSSWAFVNSGDIDLSAYAGKNIQFAFRYISDGTGTATATYEVKNVVVAAGGSTIFEESFGASLGEFTEEGDLPEGLSSVWSYAAGYGAKASAYAGGTRYVTDVCLVSPTIALTAGATLNFDHALNYLKIDNKTDYIKVMVREIIKMSKEEANSPYYAKVTSIADGGQYLMAAEVDGVLKAATPLSGNYGYLSPTELEGTRVLASDEVNALAWTITKTEAGYTIQDVVNGKYLYMSGTYNSFNVKASYNAEDGYDWAVEAQADGTFKITNILKEKYVQYDTQYNSYGSYNTAKGILPCLLKYYPAPAAQTRSSLPVVGYNASAVYVFDGSSWAEAKENGVDIQAVDPSIYNTLGVEYISNPAAVLPEYMHKHNPYAEEGDVVAIVYLNSSNKLGAKELSFTNGEWVVTTTVETATDQFVRASGVWNYDPSVIIELLSKGELTTLYYQTATDWVWENVDVPAGCTAKGQGYVTSYGNNDYFGGCSAYYGNVDWRPAKAKEQNPDGYKDMSDEQVLAKMQENFITCMEPTMAKLHPEAKPVDGVTVTYTLNFIVYTGGNATWTVQFEVTAPGTFKYVEGSLKPVE